MFFSPEIINVCCAPSAAPNKGSAPNNAKDKRQLTVNAIDRPNRAQTQLLMMEPCESNKKEKKRKDQHLNLFFLRVEEKKGQTNNNWIT